MLSLFQFITIINSILFNLRNFHNSRSNRLVNWSCTLRSAISDIEVDKVSVARHCLKTKKYVSL